MERPALVRLLEDIDSGKVDSLVVYKVDRLTRSLADFAKIIERFDKRSVSFVSVTQQFNTTSSMGRLTLNVLLSFAQFEREVTGERIRDKIAASKRKGMWMGGNVPLGYDLKERRLHVNASEARTVRHIFRRYLRLGCVSKLKFELQSSGIRSKVRVSAKGNKTGDAVYSRGALYKILQNRLYIGEIAHRRAIHKGEHQSLVSQDVWESVQKQLQTNGQARRNETRVNHSSLLVGLMFNSDGVRLTPTHSVKQGKRFRYYAGRTPEGLSHRVSVAAPAVEKVVIDALARFLSQPDGVIKDALSELPLRLKRKARDAAADIAQRISEPGGAHPGIIRSFTSRVTIDKNEIEIEVDVLKLRTLLLGDAFDAAMGSAKLSSLRVQATLAQAAPLTRLLDENGLLPPANGSGVGALAKAICRAHLWRERLISGEVRDSKALSRLVKLDERYVNRVLTIGFLSPKLVEQILRGKQPKGLTLELLNKGRIPPLWSAQEQLF